MIELHHKRTNNYLKQIKGSVLFKLGAILASFIAMPIMIKYLGMEMFGIWATMLTLISWVMLFDLGIGNGLKNKVSESLAKNDTNLASAYISTAYVVIGLVSLVLLVIFLVLSFWVPWQGVFNTNTVSEESLRMAVISLSFFVFFNFWLSLVNQIYHGIQKSSVVVLGQFLSNFSALIVIFLLYKHAPISLTYMVFAYGGSLISANIGISCFLFYKRRDLKPRFGLFDNHKIKPLLSLGLNFFIIQIAVLAIFMTDKILITQLLGPAEVTPYEVVFKLFSVITIVHGLILAPLWPAYTDAYHKNDFHWIRKTLRNQLKIFLILSLLTILMIAIAPKIISLWIGSSLNIDDTLYLFMGLFIIISVWSNVFAYFVNAIGALRVQTITAVISGIGNIPLSIYFAKNLDMGLSGIVLGTACSLSLFAIFGAVQVYLIMKKSGSQYA